jgi:hypothetical protein
MHQDSMPEAKMLFHHIKKFISLSTGRKGFDFLFIRKKIIPLIGFPGGTIANFIIKLAITARPKTAIDVIIQLSLVVDNGHISNCTKVRFGSKFGDFKLKPSWKLIGWSDFIFVFAGKNSPKQEDAEIKGKTFHG